MVDDEIAAALRERSGGATAPRVLPLPSATRPLVSRSWPVQHRIVPEHPLLKAVRLLLPLFPRGLKDAVKRVAERLMTPSE